MIEAARTPPLPTPSRTTPLFGVGVALSLLIGVGAGSWLPALLPWPLMLALLLAGGWGWWRGRGLRCLGALVLGFGLVCLHATHALSLQLPIELEKGDFVVSGRIVDLPEHEIRRTRFTFRIDRHAAIPEPLRGRDVRLSWYDGWGEPDGLRQQLRAGEQWSMTLRLRAPRGLRNPGGFDSEKYALARRTSASGYVRAPETAQLQSPAVGLTAWRESMSERIGTSITASPSGRFVQALALGDTRGLSDEDWELLRANGLTHLIAISGFHVGLVAGFAALACGGLWWLLPGLGRWCPRPIAAALAGLAGAALYAAVAGFALPTVRTVLMIAVVAATRWQRRPLRIADALALAAITILLVDPLSVLMAGFWLSFAGVAWLIWCLPDVSARPRRPVHEFLSAQGVATLGLLPLTVILFGQASLAGPFANLIAVPWWSLVVVPLSLIGTALESLHAGWGSAAWQLAARCFDLSWPVFEWLAATGLAVWWLPETRWFALPLALLAALWSLLPRGLPGRPLALLLWLPLLWPARNLPDFGEADIHVLDVGQGLSVVVRTAGHTLLYDMGPAVPDGFDAGERAVVPALRALGVRGLDAAVVSHADNDHAGGLAAVQRSFSMQLAYAPEGSGVADAGACTEGIAWDWDGVSFRFLHPPPYFPYLRNEASCVLRIETAHGVALLTGDIGEVVERELVRRDAAAVRTDVVLVAHHGSDGSSDPGFIAATGARHALVASGHGNRFGHPKPEVLARWHQAGAITHDTATGGALRVQLRPGGAHVETRRRSHPRLWDAQARWEQGAAGLSYRPE